jgi:hypothetical protein
LIFVIFYGCKVVDFDNLSKSQIVKYQIEKIEILKRWPDGEELKYKVKKYSHDGILLIDSGINESYRRNFIIVNSYNSKNQLTKSIYYDDDSSIYQIFLYQYNKNGKRKQVKHFQYIDSEEDTLYDEMLYVYKYKGRLQEIHTNYGDSIKLDFTNKFNLFGRKVLILPSEHSIAIKEKLRYNMYGKLKHTISEDKKTKYKYDLLSRKTKIIYSDSSRYEYKYRKNNLITRKYFNSEGKLISVDSFSYSNGLLRNKTTYNYENYKFIERKLEDSTFIAEYLPIIDYSVKPTIYLYKYTKRK